ncbi:MAG: NUDIX domain-containing protein [Candidatus Saccharibacteria bacterium]
MKQSAGLLVFRPMKQDYEVLLVHPAGPIFGHKDIWSIPKGEREAGENQRATAYREFAEEVGVSAPTGELIDLGSHKSTNGKANFIWAVRGEVDITQFSSNNFTMEWPPKTGRRQEFPENDQAAWFELSAARQKIFPSQNVFIDRLIAILGRQET